MSEGITLQERNRVMTRFMNTLRISGYNRKYRYTLLQGVLKRVRQCEALVANGMRVRYRSREQIIEQKKARLGKHPSTWFLRGRYTNTLKTHYTPGGRLRDKLDKCINATNNADGGLTKIVELAGKPVLAGLKKTVNFGGNVGCQMGTGTKICIIDEDENCRISKSVYGINCNPCKINPNTQQSVYIGTTARTTHSRQVEHRRAILGASNALVKRNNSTQDTLASS